MRGTVIQGDPGNRSLPAQQIVARIVFSNAKWIIKNKFREYGFVRMLS